MLGMIPNAPLEEYGTQKRCLLHFSSVKSRFKKQTKFSQSEVGYMDPCKKHAKPSQEENQKHASKENW